MDLSQLSQSWENGKHFLKGMFPPQMPTAYADEATMNAAAMMSDQPNPSMMSDMWSKFRQAPMTDQLNAISGTIGALGTAYGAYNTVKTANKQLDFTKDAWNKNFQAQRNTINAEMADTQRARVASNPNAYQSVDSYMKQYGV